MKRKLKLTAYVILGIILLLVVVFFIFRNTALHRMADRKVKQLAEKEIIIAYDRLSFTGLSTVYITGFVAGEKNHPPILEWDSMSVSLAFFPMVIGNINVDKIQAGKIRLFALKNDSVCNYNSMFRKDTLKTETDTVQSVSDYSKALGQIISRLTELSPEQIHISAIHIGSDINGKYASAYIPDVVFEDDLFTFQLIRRQGKEISRMRVAGKVVSDERMIFAKSICDKGFVFPFVDRSYGLISGFDTAVFRVKYDDSNSRVLQFAGSGQMQGLFVKHDRIAPDTIFMPPMQGHFIVNTGSNFIELDSTSVFIMNRLAVKVGMKYEREKSRRISLAIRTGEMEAGDLFSSLPGNLFTTLKGIETKGKVDFRLDFYVDMAIPDSLILNAEFKRKDFRISRYGAVNYAHINEPFTHTVYEKYGQVRSFEVGPSNPYYCPYASVSRHLVNAILCTEDGAFFQHRGFIPEAFRESAATNIKEKRFARGGSTITMQLVKNVFLNRNKNIARKAEEMIIVWLIENNGLVSKERMMEVYLNIIEWGPGLYGVGEAADFYFGKKPSALSVDESIFLASIIPIPRYFKSRFQPDGSLKPETTDFIRLIRNKMIVKQMISPADTLVWSLNFRPELIQSLVVPADSTHK